MKRFIMKTLAALLVLVFTVLPLSAAEVVTYYHNDHLGSPIASTDSSGAVIWQQAYDPWGLKLTTKPPYHRVRRSYGSNCYPNFTWPLRSEIWSFNVQKS
ncbi:MAG: RHS domain-containing protein [Marinobacter sp.]|nr:RHS domain-containing protein [Marinobacter sp.]